MRDESLEPFPVSKLLKTAGTFGLRVYIYVFYGFRLLVENVGSQRNLFS